MKYKSLVVYFLMVLNSNAEVDHTVQKKIHMDCRPCARASFSDDINAISKTFMVDGKPINPLIIRELIFGVSECADQIVGIDLLGSQNSNRYYYDQHTLKPHGNFFSVNVRFIKEDSPSSFTYTIEGLTDNGVFVIRTEDYEGGSYVDRRIIFVRIREDMSLGCIKNGKISLNRKRIILENMGYIEFDYKSVNDIKVEKNNVTFKTTENSPPYREGVEKILLSLEGY